MTNTPMTPDRLTEIRNRKLDEVTAGPWLVADDENGRPVVYVETLRDGRPGVRVLLAADGASETDVQFVASARHSVPDLLAEVDRLRARVAELEAGLPVMQKALCRALDRVTELESATGTARAMHRKYSDSEHCQYDGMTWPCPTVTALGEQPALRGQARLNAKTVADAEATHWKRLGIDPSKAAELAEGLAGLDAMRADHPAPCRVPDSPDCACPNEHPMDRALRLGATRIPEDLVIEICEATNTGRPTGWPTFYDRDSEVWELTCETHDGDTVMLPSASDMQPMLRRDVEKHFGPLTSKGTS